MKQEMGLALAYAREAMRERYGNDNDLRADDEMRAAVRREIIDDWLAGFRAGYRRGRLDEKHGLAAPGDASPEPETQDK